MIFKMKMKSGPQVCAVNPVIGIVFSFFGVADMCENTRVHVRSHHLNCQIKCEVSLVFFKHACIQ
jgi:hypothetical protein